LVSLRDLRAANGAVKLVRVVHTKRLGLFRQPRTGSTLPVDGRSFSPVNKNSSDDVEQASEVGSIDQTLIDNRVGFSFESLYFQSKTSMEDDLFLAQGEYPHFCNSFSNQSIIEEHLSNENLLECSSTPIKLIREEVTQETLNLDLQNALHS
jgi:hypothetical protein